MGKPLPAKTWFERADNFYWACAALMDGRMHLYEILGFPHIVLRAFAAEAYLKCLIALQGGTHEDTHNLLDLFDKLDLAAKKALNKRWVNECEPTLKRLKKTRKTVIKFDTSLRGVLNQSADAFIDFRYIQPGEEARFSIMRFPMFVRGLILEREPSWEPKQPNPLAQLNPESSLAKPKKDDLSPVAVRPAILNPKTAAGKLAAQATRSANPNNRGSD